MNSELVARRGPSHCVTRECKQGRLIENYSVLVPPTVSPWWSLARVDLACLICFSKKYYCTHYHVAIFRVWLLLAKISANIRCE